MTWQGLAPATPSPWEGVPLRAYRDPKAATEFLLQGLIANALAGCTDGVTDLAQIRYEVAFPVPDRDCTPGMRYARRTYGRDGWGRPFSFELLREGRVRVSSAGPNGRPGDSDDIAWTTPARGSATWELRVKGVYLRELDDGLAFFIHRVADLHFRFANQAGARTATGSNCFDRCQGERRSSSEPCEKAQAFLLAEVGRRRSERPAGSGVKPVYFLRMTAAEDG